MAKSNKDRIGEALDLFVFAYRPFVVETLANKYKVNVDEAAAKAQEFLSQGARAGSFIPSSPDEWDVGSIFSIVQTDWQYNFRYQLDSADRSMLHEVKDVRNGWAHQKSFNINDTQRALDTVHRLLLSIGAQKEAQTVDELAQETMRTRFAEMQRVATDRAKRKPTEGTPSAGLRPWRDVMVPHKDVREGNFTLAQFAADLAQVYRGDAAAEYGEPKEFFRRTFLTEGLRTLIKNTIKRFNGDGGNPVIELQTNFGGGKTHSMLALYHLCSDLTLSSLPGVDAIAEEMDASLPKVARSVLVGTALTPGMLGSHEGVTPQTLWGLMAVQLGGKPAYDLIRQADETGMSPGSDLLVSLFNSIGKPCLILIDEWVAYCRQLWNQDNHPAGSFDTNLSFAQSLTEAAKSCPNVLIVASLPQSKVEVGGDAGRQALASLEDTFGRIEFSWRPASQGESYEIVRRRLFEPLESGDAFANRDAVINAFRKFYKENEREFPSAASDAGYYKRMEDSYPIHPEMFDRLYNDWSTLEQFQRTRGVLRLMASVIHNLWMRGDSSLMILPGIIPLDDASVQEEFTRYLSNPWKIVLDKEVDGKESLPIQIDKSSQRFGKVWAARRAARSVFIGSGATETSSSKGLERRFITLACAQPGENISVFGDALRQISEQASHVYHDGAQYWFSPQPNVINVARDRARGFEEDQVTSEAQSILKRNARDKGGFTAVHPCPESSADIVDDPALRLVILSPLQAHSQNSKDSAALTSVAHYLQKRGNSPRINQNSVIFLAPDKAKLEDLYETIRLSMAWRSIVRDQTALDLSPYNLDMAERKVQEMDSAVQLKLLECYQWAISPFQQTGTSDTEWKCVRVTAGDQLPQRVFLRLRRDGDICDQMSGLGLKKALDAGLWRGKNHVTVSQVQEDFARYLYLEKLTNQDVIVEALQDAVAQMDAEMALAYAEEYDDNRYEGLVVVNSGAFITGKGLIVKYDIAQAQKKAPQPVTVTPPIGGGTGTGKTGGTTSGTGTEGDEDPKPELPSRYFGEFEVDPTNPLMFSDVMKEVVTHLVKHPNTKVNIAVNIDAEDGDGFDDITQRIIRENSKTLGFNNSEFTD